MIQVNPHESVRALQCIDSINAKISRPPTQKDNSITPTMPTVEWQDLDFLVSATHFFVSAAPDTDTKSLMADTVKTHYI